jgi:hypothetical protein
VAVKTNNIVEPPQLKDQKKHLKAAALRAYAAPKKQSLENQRISQLLPMVPKIAQPQKITTLHITQSSKPMPTSELKGLSSMNSEAPRPSPQDLTNKFKRPLI